MHPHTLGLVIVSAGVAVMSADTLLVRLAGISGPDVAFWRGLLIALTFSTFLTVRQFFRSPSGGGTRLPGIPETLRRSGPAILIPGLCSGLSSFLFPLAVTNTSAANALVILSCTPLIGALLSRIFLGERIPARTAVAIILVIGGVASIFADSLGGGGIFGDLMSAGTGLFMAGLFVSLRLFPDVSKPGALMIGGFTTAFLASWQASPLGVPGESFLWLGLLGCIVMPVSVALMSMGTKYISAPEIGLLMIGETILGILWIYLAFHELPSETTAWGGTFVVTTLVLHSWAGIRAHRTQ